jgi:putative glutamine amidotransferase
MNKNPIIGIIPNYRPIMEDGHLSKKSHYFIGSNYIENIIKHESRIIILPYDYSAIEFYLNLIDGLLIIGGSFDINPEKYKEKEIHPTTNLNNVREDFEFEFMKQKISLKPDMPFLGICNGMQILNIVFGGSINQHILDDKNKIDHEQNHIKGFEDYSKAYHKVKITEGSKLFQISQGKKNISTNSSHHQAVKNVGDNILISAISGDGTIEAIEEKNHPFSIGVQWHPEFNSSEIDKNLFKSFIDSCALAISS